MGNPTSVAFIKETVFCARPVEVETATAQSFVQWAAVCLMKAQHYTQKSPAMYRGIAYEIYEQIAYPPFELFELWENPLSLEEYGQKFITQFPNTGVWDDAELLRPLLSGQLQLRILGIGENRFPKNMDTPLKRIIKAVDLNEAMMIIESHEMGNLADAVGTVKEKLIFDREWEAIIQSHEITTYDFALFNSLV